MAVAAEHEPHTREFKQAMTAADMALNDAFRTMHNVEPLEPVLGAAATRLRRAR